MPVRWNEGPSIGIPERRTTGRYHPSLMQPAQIGSRSKRVTPTYALIGPTGVAVLAPHLFVLSDGKPLVGVAGC